MSQGITTNLFISIIPSIGFILTALYFAVVRRHHPTWRIGLVLLLICVEIIWVHGPPSFSLGIWYWIFLAYSYLVMGLGSYFLLQLIESSRNQEASHTTAEQDTNEHERSEKILQQYRLLSQNIRDIILFIRASDGQILEANPAAVEAYGYDLQELLTKNIRDLRPPETQHLVGQQLDQANTAGILFETLHLRKDGSIFPAEINSTGMTLGNERVLLSIIRNVTDRKHMEQELLLTQFGIEQASIGIIRTGSDARILSANQRICQMLGYTAEELCNLHVYEIDPNFPLDKWKEHRSYIRQHGSATFETIHRRKDGTTYPVEITTTFFLFQNSEFSFAFVRDITERRRAEEALRRSEMNLAEAQRISHLGSWDWGLASDKIQFSDEMFQIMGLLPGEVEITREMFLKFLHQDEAEWLIDEIEHGGPHISGGIEHRIIRPNGEIRVMYSQAKAYRDENGRPLRLLGYTQDITERKQAEEAVIQRAAELSTVAEISIAASTLLDTDILLQKTVDLTQKRFNLYHAHIYLLNEAGNILLLTAGAGQTGRQMVAKRHSIPLNCEQSLVARAARTRQGVVINDVSQAPDFLPNPLLPKTCSEMAIPIIFGEQVLGVLDVQSDRVDHFSEGDINIQSTLAAEIANALQNARQYQQIRITAASLQGIQNAINEGAIVAITDVSGKIEFVNDNFIFSSKYSREELIGQDLRIINLDYRAKEYIRNPWETITNGKVWRGELCNRDKDGILYWIDTTISPIIDESGRPVKYISVGFDITERKRVEDALRQKSEELDKFFSSALDLLCIADTDGHFRRLNAEWERSLGYSISELEGQQFIDFVHPEDQAATLEAVSALTEGQAILNFTNRYRHKDGTYRWIEWRSFPAGKMIYAAARDITEHMQTEQALRESENNYRQLFEAESDAIFLIENETGRILQANQAASALYGYSHNELLAMKNTDLSSEPEQTQKVTSQTQPAPEKVVNIPLRWHRKKDGTHFPVEITGRFFIRAGQPVHIAAIRDITERRLAEEALLTSEEHYRTYFENFPIGVYRVTAGPAGKHVMANAAYLKMFGYASLQELVQQANVSDLYLNPAERKVFSDTLLAKGHVERVELQLKRSDGTPIWGAVTASVAHDKNGEVYFDCAIEDITQRKQAEKALKESEEKFRSIVENSLAGIFMVDDSFRFVYVNDELCRILAYPSDKLTGLDFRKVLTEDSKKLVTDRYIRRQRGELVPPRYELKVMRRDGEVRDTEMIVTVVKDVSGKPRSMGQLVDITERKRAEQALVMYQYSIDQASDAIFWMNRDAEFTYVNDQACRSLGYTREELTHLKLWDIDPVYPKERWYANWEQYQEQRHGGSENVETLHRRKDGYVFPVDVSSTHLWFGNEELHVAVVRDITERKRMEKLIQALNAAALAMQKAFTPSETFIAVSDELKKIDFACAIFAINDNNDQLMLKHYTYQSQAIKTVERLIGLRVEDFSIPIDSVTTFRKSIQERKTLFLETLIDTAQQALPAPISTLAETVIKKLGVSKAIIAPLIVEDQVIGLFTVQADDLRESDEPTMTAFANQLAAAWHQSQLFEQAKQDLIARTIAEAKVIQLNEELEQRVIERTAQLEAANKELEAFAYSVSHDLRAPLRAIDGYTRILTEDYKPSLGTEGKRVCDIIQSEAHRMGGLIDDLLTFSRFGRADMLTSKINMKTMVQSVFQELTSMEDRMRIDFHVGILPHVEGDSKLIRQVWINLISNAIKFSSKRDRAVIHVSGERGGKEIIFSVKDNGVGFDNQYISKLFGVFQRLHSEKEFPGTGVGLAIVQRIILRHGGRVWAQSDSDQGATFFFTLPRKEARHEST
jgi:PAS domain S-box-containing protein